MKEGYFIPALVANTPLTFLVDTGSNVTILRRDLLDSWPQQQQPSIIPVNTQLITATGECSPFHGKAVIDITIGSQTLKQEILFADIKNDGILGMDFLGNHSCDVLLSKDHLVLNGERITCFRNTENAPPVSCRIALLESVEIPPECEIIVKGRPLDRFDKDGVGVLESSDNLTARYGLLVAKALVCPKRGTVPLRIMNMNHEPIYLYKNTVTAIYEPVQPGSFETVSSLGTENIPEEKSYSHLEDLIELSTENLNESQKESMKTLLYEYADQFSRSSHDLGSTSIAQHTIKIVPGCKPIKQRPYRVPLAKQQVAQKEIQLMAEKNLIEPSYSAWSSPALLVPKKDGTMRFCVDYRRLNEATIPDSHPLPRIDDTLSALGWSKWFSTLDLKSGYHQIQIQESDRPLTAFSIPGSGLWQFRVLPFGLINAPGVFERLMEHVFAGLTYVTLLIYLDDIIVYSKTFETHLDSLREILQRLKEVNLKLNPKKCCLFCTSVSFLGHQVSEQGISMWPLKIQTIKDWPQPKNVKEVRQFIGLASYYRKFLSQFAQICKPLHKLTEKDVPFIWNQDHQTAFEAIKILLTTGPVLSYPSPDGQTFILDCDASNAAVGAVLHQLQDGEEKVIGYYSKCLSRSERKYCTTRKELVAVVKAIKYFHHFLYGQPFIVRSDHGSLQWLLNFRNHGEGQLARFLETLSAYSFKIQYRAGRTHRNADAMSRRPCYDSNCHYCTRYESRYDKEIISEQELNSRYLSNSESVCSTTVKFCGSETTVENSSLEDCKKPDTCIDGMHELGQDEHQMSAPIFLCQDCDPDDYYIGPKGIDNILCGSSASTPTSLDRGVTSVVSNEMTLRDVTGCGPSPIVSCLRTNVVDERTHKINYTSCPPDFYCQEADSELDDWMDHFEDESLFGCLFGPLDVDENEFSLSVVYTRSESLPLLNTAETVASGSLSKDCFEERDLYHAGVISTRRNAHGNLVHRSCDSEVSCRCVVPNQYPSDDPQSGKNKGDVSDKYSSVQTQTDGYNGRQIVAQAIDRQADVCLELTKDNILIKQEEDPILKLLLQWKRDDVKPPWSGVSQYCKELKVYWHAWNLLEVQDGIFCKTHERDDGTGTDYLYILPASLRKEAFRHLHEFITGGHLGRAKTYEKIRKRFYWCNMHRDVSYWCRICSTCGARKTPPRRAKAPMRQYNVGCPMERIAIDISGPYQNRTQVFTCCLRLFHKMGRRYPVANPGSVSCSLKVSQQIYCNSWITLTIAL